MTTILSAATLVFGPWSVGVGTALIALCLYVRDSGWFRPVALTASVGAAGIICEALKLAVGRPRPPVLDQLGWLETTPSYPSGHVTGTTALVLTTLVLLRSPESGRRAGTFVAWAVGAAVVAFAAITRLYLGVHWFSDVLAGIAVGIGVTALTIPTVRHAFDSRGHRHRSNPHPREPSFAGNVRRHPSPLAQREAPRP